MTLEDALGHTELPPGRRTATESEPDIRYQL
jgi:hypothetical protein